MFESVPVRRQVTKSADFKNSLQSNLPMTLTEFSCRSLVEQTQFNCNSFLLACKMSRGVAREDGHAGLTTDLFCKLNSTTAPSLGSMCLRKFMLVVKLPFNPPPFAREIVSNQLHISTVLLITDNMHLLTAKSCRGPRNSFASPFGNLQRFTSAENRTELLPPTLISFASNHFATF
jgi:hypothetical protein